MNIQEIKIKNCKGIYCKSVFDIYDYITKNNLAEEIDE